MKPNLGKFVAIYTTTIATLCLTGCQKRPASGTVTDPTAFARQLPLDSPEIVVQKVLETQFSPAQNNYLYRHLLYAAIDSLPQATVFKHLQHYETVCEGDSSARAFAQLMRGELYNAQGKFDSALLVLNESRALFHSLNDANLEGDACRQMADTYGYQGDYTKATEILYKGIECYGDSADAYKKLICLNDLAVNFRAQGNNTRAKGIFESVILAAQQQGNGHIVVSGLLGLTTVYSDLNKPDSALLFARRMLTQIAQNHQQGDRIFEALAYRWMGKAYVQKKAWGTALQYLNKADNMFSRIGEDSFRVRIWLNQADCFRELKSFHRAEPLYLQILQNPLFQRNQVFQVQVHEGMALLYEAMKDPGKALEHVRAAKTITDSIKVQERTKAIEQLNFQFENTQQEQRMLMLAQSNKITNLRVATILALLILVIGVLLFSWYRQRSRQRLLMTENHLLSAREHAAQARIKALEIFTQSLLNKNRRLTTGIAEVIQADRNVFAKPPAETESRVEEEMPIQMKILTEEDWQTYLHYFEQAYHGFITQVQERFPNLTPAELRLFLLLKQGYDTKEIAELLGISIAGAKKTRYRLRKKIGLEEMDNLDQFVREF